MDPEPITPPAPPIKPTHTFLPLLLTLVVILAASTGFLMYQNMQLKKLLSAPTTYEQCLASAGSIIQESYPATCITKNGTRFTQTLTEEEQKNTSPTANEPRKPDSSDMKQYTNTDGTYSFQHPSNWTVLSQVPKEFQATKSYTEGESIDTWLNGKMLSATCKGPILHNTYNPNELIVFEIVSNGSDGGWCWSTGYFFETNKWKVAEKYTYPIRSSTIITPDWKGDYFVMKQVASSKQHLAAAGLVNKETYSLSGEDSLDAIISSFQFNQ